MSAGSVELAESATTLTIVARLANLSANRERAATGSDTSDGYFDAQS